MPNRAPNRWTRGHPAHAPARSRELPRRDVILDAALALSAELGTEQLTHRSVAEQAGVPLGSTTYYFASRDELVREAFRRYVVRALRELTALARSARPRDAAELVEMLVDVARHDLS